MNLKHYILLSCLFLVLCTKLSSVYEALFTDSEIELALELDEEDSSDEEDSEKETSEKELYVNFQLVDKMELADINSISKSKIGYYTHRYIAPILDTLSPPPDLV